MPHSDEGPARPWNGVVAAAAVAPNVAQAAHHVWPKEAVSVCVCDACVSICAVCPCLCVCNSTPLFSTKCGATGAPCLHVPPLRHLGCPCPALAERCGARLIACHLRMLVSRAWRRLVRAGGWRAPTLSPEGVGFGHSPVSGPLTTVADARRGRCCVLCTATAHSCEGATAHSCESQIRQRADKGRSPQPKGA